MRTSSWLIVFLYAAHAAAAPLSIAVDASQARHPISPNIYGMNGGSMAQLARFKSPVNRWGGGNPSTAYNWKTLAANRAFDWYFEDLLGSNGDVDDFISQMTGASIVPIVPITTIGWMSRCQPSASASSACKASQTDCYAADCGGNSPCSFDTGAFPGQVSVNGKAPSNGSCGTGITNVDPHSGALTWVVIPDATTETQIGYFPIDATWASDWVTHLAAENAHLFQLDNEPGAWNSTHYDIHPAPPTYAEMSSALTNYGAAIKSADPNAQVMGPVPWGWTEYFDLFYGTPDHAAHGDYLPWYLDQAKAYETTSGTRLLDYLDIHYYPQDGSYGNGSDENRLQAPRSLWDPTFVDPTTWIKAVMTVLPLMKGWIDGHYPNTKLAITEYSFGQIDTVAGAITQADVLGIFGRESVDLATLFGGPGDGAVGEDAFLLFRNYDGAGASFGATSISATKDVTVANASGNSTEILTAYAAEVSPGLLTIVLINKDTNANDVSVALEGIGSAGAWRSFQFGSTGRLAAAGSGSANAGSIGVTLAARSAMLVEYTGAAIGGAGSSGGSSSTTGGAAGGLSGGGNVGGASSGETTGTITAASSTGANAANAPFLPITNGCACRSGNPLEALWLALGVLLFRRRWRR